MHLSQPQYYQFVDDVKNGRRPDLYKSYESTEGFISIEEALLLYYLARNVGHGCILEIGSYRGQSTIFLAKGSIDGNKATVYAIDPHKQFTGVLGGKYGPIDKYYFYKSVIENNCTEVISLINLSSEVVACGWIEKISLLWIDGDHTYDGVKRDMECWIPHLHKDSIIVLDDALDPRLGPRLIINELIEQGAFSEIFQIGKVSVLCKNNGKY